jgi:hypothetical protein
MALGKEEKSLQMRGASWTSQMILEEPSKNQSKYMRLAKHAV